MWRNRHLDNAVALWPASAKPTRMRLEWGSDSSLISRHLMIVAVLTTRGGGGCLASS
ncbi:hypothetical protein Hanom_Chr02g00174031 [Helianthus anomalus]